MSRVSHVSGTVPPDVLLVTSVIAQKTATELGGWLGRVVVRCLLYHNARKIPLLCLVPRPLFCYIVLSHTTTWVLSSFG